MTHSVLTAFIMNTVGTEWVTPGLPRMICVSYLLILFCLFCCFTSQVNSRVGVIKIVIVINCNLITFSKVIACNCN